MNANQIRDLVRSQYGAIAAAMASLCCSPQPATTSTCCGGLSDRPDAGENARRMGYDETDLAAVGDGAISVSAAATPRRSPH
ncbi:MAG: hypothetical protein WCJ64_04675 [Rhodospirillaceae bacterium]